MPAARVLRRVVEVEAEALRKLRERAERLRRALRQAIQQSGFREYYDPFTGEGPGAREFTWSGLLIDML